MPNINDIPSHPKFAKVLCRFEAKFQKTTGCWIWTSHTNSKLPYGRFTAISRTSGVLAHRFAYVVYAGPIPEGMQVLHRCDNPQCVNPVHLFLGDNSTNVADKVSKGRQSSMLGERHPMAKLCAQDAIAIFRSRKAGVDLAAQYGVSPNAICKIRKRRAWQSVTAHL